MKKISLTVNGQSVTADIPARTQLADFLRDNQLLTGTHIGCEHGICGACTVMIDGAPARSCITYAVACEGAEVTTVEGLDDDPIAEELRRAFQEQHGLQCGYCTPGMMVTARDIVRRFPDADETRIRHELSGNLCRCTGYVGIVRAIRQVIEARRRNGASDGFTARSELGPVGSGHAAANAAEAVAKPAEAVKPVATKARKSAASGDKAASGPRPLNEMQRSLRISGPREQVWEQFEDIAALARCMPGAHVSEIDEAGRMIGVMRVKFGPISAAFDGEADNERVEDAYRGKLFGTGRDQRTGTRVTAEVDYALHEADGGGATDVAISVRYGLSGALAQFARGGLVEDFADRLAQQFAGNLERMLSGEQPATGDGDAGNAGNDVNAVSLVLGVLGARLRRFFNRLLGRG
ncbi:xanthine dehydrogenase family Fe-S subunit [Ferruginivarius sediminum]|uniref:Carbon monoxide dehydrogenase n=1 Tax=Ferruginivarius sediminum TaxID=2661937 RepID=A0A369T8B4_9PROT|nr:carbon monoxide dehydrogenase [Ferruginivarius sediminum]